MTIEIKEDRYFIAIWFVEGDRIDYLAAAYRDKGETIWHIISRFRYHEDKKSGLPGDESADRKTWMEMTSTDTEEHVEAAIDTVCSGLVTEAGMRGPVTKILCKTDDCTAIAEAMTSMPWAQSQKYKIAGSA